MNAKPRSVNPFSYTEIHREDTEGHGDSGEHSMKEYSTGSFHPTFSCLSVVLIQSGIHVRLSVKKLENLKNPVIIVLALFFFLGACSKEDSIMKPAVPAAPCAGCISFSAPAVGQQSRYLLFEGESRYEKEVPKLTYLNDTLTVRIVGEEDGVFTLEEFLSSDPESRNIYQIWIAEDSLNLGLGKEGNIDFYLFSGCCVPFKLPLIDQTAFAAELNGWDASVLGCDTSPCIGYLEGHEQLGFRYERLNIYRNYGPLAYDGLGYYFLYSEEYGIVRATKVSAWMGTPFGIDLILSDQ